MSLKNLRHAGALALALLLLPIVAHAQAAVVGPSAGVTYLDEAIKGVFGAVLSALVAWVALHVRNALLRQAINLALSRAGALALDFMTAQAGTLDAVALRHTAVGRAVSYMLSTMPKALRTFGITPDRVTDMVSAELAKLEGGKALVAPAVGLSTLQPAMFESVAPGPAHLTGQAIDAVASAVVTKMAAATASATPATAEPAGTAAVPVPAAA
jgi:hypothetical protein